MKFPAATSAVFFFDVGRAKNCSFHTFPVIASLRLDSAPWDNSKDRCGPRWQTTNRMPFGFEARHQTGL
jgi:hypothetical protein